MENNRDFKGVWIPKEIWLNKDLTALDKFIFAEIDSLDNDNHCIASNEYLAEFCGCSSNKVSTSISKLIKMGLIEQVSFDGRHRKLSIIKNNMQTFKNKNADLQKEKSIKIDNNKTNTFLNNNLFKNNNITKTGTDLYTFCINCIDDFCSKYSENGLRDNLIKYLNLRLEMKDRPLYKNMWKSLLAKLGKCYSESSGNVDFKDIINQSIEKGYPTFYPITNNYKKQKADNIYWKDSYDLSEAAYERSDEKF